MSEYMALSEPGVLDRFGKCFKESSKGHASLIALESASKKSSYVMGTPLKLASVRVLSSCF